MHEEQVCFICPFCEQSIEKDMFKSHVDAVHRGEQYHEYYMSADLISKKCSEFIEKGTEVETPVPS